MKNITEHPTLKIDFCYKKLNRVASTFILCVVLAVLTLAVYLQVESHKFINIDDNSYVTNNSHIAGGVTSENIIWAFSSVDEANWHPLTWLSHMVDVGLYGMNPQGHHLTNVAIHTLSALLLFIFLIRLTDQHWQSFFVAALFALHPIHVESVAWVAERKDVLSTFFWTLTLVFYCEYAKKQGPAFYIFALVSFMLGLMSKPMLVTLPLIMLLLDFWPLGRYHTEIDQILLKKSKIATLIKEKIPFFLCSILSCIITIYAQHKGGAIVWLTAMSFQLRFENALTAYLKYIGKILWPVELAVYYPISLPIPLWQVIGSFSVLFLISVAAIMAISRHPYFTVGWFWFIITLIPVIGLIQVGGQAMADRYSYIPSTGLFIMAAWGMPTLTRSIKQRRVILALLTVVVIITSAVMAYNQLGYWKNSISLYKHTLKITTGNFMIHNSLGNTLASKGDFNGAIKEYKEALHICPNYADAHTNLGVAIANLGDLTGAIKEYREALRISQGSIDAHINLGVALESEGILDAAILEYQEAVRISPHNSDAHNNLGGVLAKSGDLDGAIMEYHEALRLNRMNKKAYNNLGVALVSKGDIDGAIQKFREALRICPDDKNYSTNLDTALTQKKIQEEAERQLSPLQLNAK